MGARMNSTKVLMPKLIAFMRGIFTNLPLLLAGLLITGAATGRGAVAFNQSIISAESDVLNTGTLISANNLGSSPAVATVNGIGFGTSQSGLTGWANGGGDFSTSFTGGLDTLMSGLAYVSPGTSGTLVINGLTSGRTYRVQLLIQNAVNTSGDNTSITIQGVTHNVGTLGNSAYNVRAEFTATGTSETITFDDASGSDPILNAYVVHGLPEVDVQGNGVSIASGDTTPSTTDHTDFGSTIVNGGTITRTFTITNSGGGILNLSGASKVAISGAGASHFSVT